MNVSLRFGFEQIVEIDQIRIDVRQQIAFKIRIQEDRACTNERLNQLTSFW
ncbi:Uncharacterised protein [Vibrio cholerae]|nr:Uncharacterised protein [Vibrio cholerae]CSD15014.1 Uncharacterised protein [Vibrio cholerae]CSI18659.1 Uncharacterised protein [Vibrio cholerae]